MAASFPFPIDVHHSRNPAASERAWALIGIPDHQGVMNVGGRLGAALGPSALRRVFASMRSRAPVHESLAWDRDVSGLTTQIEENHRLAAAEITRAHQVCRRSVVVGGGHDHGFSHLLGLRQAFPQARLGCMNLDAHFDVRKADPVITSGSPFYLGLEKGVLQAERFIEFGIQSHCNAPELWEYIEQRKVRVVPFEELRHGRAVAAFESCLRSLEQDCDQIAISLDLDAASSAFAPGVSAPQAEGFTSGEVIEMAELAGASAKVCSLGIFELNPLHDLDSRTARLAATAAYHFVARALHHMG